MSQKQSLNLPYVIGATVLGGAIGFAVSRFVTPAPVKDTTTSDRLRQSEQKVKQLEDEVKNLTSQLQSKQEQLTRAEEGNKTTSAELEESRKEIETAKSEHENNERISKQKDKEITTLRKKIKQLEIDLDSANMMKSVVEVKQEEPFSPQEGDAAPQKKKRTTKKKRTASVIEGETVEQVNTEQPEEEVVADTKPKSRGRGRGGKRASTRQEQTINNLKDSGYLKETNE
jgi:peptidoglycan hydrolase CwlO-like protein